MRFLLNLDCHKKMKRYLITICLAVGMVLPAAAQFTPIRIGENAKKVILNKYDTNYAFHDGLLAVKNDETGLWGFIDEQGNKVIDYQWDYKSFGYPQFGGGACLVCKSGRDMWGRTETWYVINKQGRAIKLNARIIDSAPFNKDGYALIVKTVNDRYSKCTYIDRQGREVFPALVQTMLTVGAQSPEEVRPFSNGLAAFYDMEKRRYGFFDKAGKIICRAIYLKVQDFSEGLAAVKVTENGGWWGFIDVSGKMVIPAKFSKEPYPFREGKASVAKREGGVVMIDKTGTVISPEFEDIRNFYLGYAYAQFKDRRYMDIVDENFNVVRAQLENKMLDPTRRNGEPIEFINGYSTWAGSSGASLPFLLSPIGKMLRFSSDWGESIDVKHRTEKVIHVKLKKYDGFIDYDGNIVFYFAEDEF